MIDSRDRIAHEAAEHLGKGNLRRAMEVLQRLELGTVDARTLELTDAFLPQIAAGRTIVGTSVPSRKPDNDEVVIIYGNYPHSFGNVVVNNPIKRHIADFWNFRHDRIEYNPSWEGLDQIFVINADDRLDRYDAVLRELCLARAPLHRISRVAALKGDTGHAAHVDGHIGCLKSHLKVLQRIQSAHFEHALVLEDDFCFTSDLETHLADLAEFFARCYDYWICLIATSKYGAVVPKDDLLSTSFQPCTNSAGYIVSREGASVLVPVFEAALKRMRATGVCESNTVDQCWAVLQPGGKFVVFRRKFGFQVSGYSDIEGAITRYLD
jgi:hypothetical protein